MSRNRKKSRKGRLAATGLLAAIVAVLLGYFRCGYDFGLGFLEEQMAERVADAPSRPADAAVVPGDAASISDGRAAEDAATTGEDAGVARCQLRLDRTGLTVAGEPASVEAAVAVCREAGAADLVITGDAAFGAAEELRAALEGAGVAVYER